MGFLIEGVILCILAGLGITFLVSIYKSAALEGNFNSDYQAMNKEISHRAGNSVDWKNHFRSVREQASQHNYLPFLNELDQLLELAPARSREKIRQKIVRMDGESLDKIREIMGNIG